MGGGGRQPHGLLLLLLLLLVVPGSGRVKLEGGDVVMVNKYKLKNQRNPSVAWVTAEHFVVVWMSQEQDGDDEGVYGQVLDTRGGTVGNEFSVNTYWKDAQASPKVAALEGGGFVVVWSSLYQDSSSFGVFLQLFDPWYRPKGSETQVNTQESGIQYATDVVGLKDGGFVVVYDGADGKGAGVFAQLFNASGVKLGSEFQVNINIEGHQAKASVAALPDGAFIVSYEGLDNDGKGILSRRFNANGTPVSSEFKCNSHTTGIQEKPSVVGLPQGDMVVLWADSTLDGSNYGIFGQALDSNAVFKNDPFQVNFHTELSQKEAIARAFPSGSPYEGDYVVAWTSDREDGDRDGVYVRFMSYGPPEIPLQASVVTKGSQNGAGLATSATGFVVVWMSDEGGDSDIFARVFSPVAAASPPPLPQTLQPQPPQTPQVSSPSPQTAQPRSPPPQPPQPPQPPTPQPPQLPQPPPPQLPQPPPPQLPQLPQPPPPQLPQPPPPQLPQSPPPQPPQLPQPPPPQLPQLPQPPPPQLPQLPQPPPPQPPQLPQPPPPQPQSPPRPTQSPQLQPQTSDADGSMEVAAKAEGWTTTSRREVAAQISSTAAVASVLGSGSGMATRLIIVSQSCYAAVRPSFFPYAIHPTGLKIEGSLEMGMVLGNFTVMAAVCLLGYLLTRMCAVCVSAFFPGRAGRVDVKGLLHFPSVPLFVFQVLYTGTVMGAVRLMFYPLTGFGIVLGTFTLFFAMGFPLVLLRTVVVDIPQHVIYYPDPCTTSLCEAVSIGRGEWVSQGPQPHWTGRYSSVLREYRGGFAWYCFVEYSASFTLSLVQSLEPETTYGCGHLRAACAAVFSILLVLELWLMPRARPKDVVLTASVLGMQLCAMVVMSAGFYRSRDFNDGFFELADALLLFCSLTLMAKVASDALAEGWVLMSSRRRRLYELLRDEKSPRPVAEEEEDEEEDEEEEHTPMPSPARSASPRVSFSEDVVLLNNVYSSFGSLPGRSFSLPRSTSATEDVPGYRLPPCPPQRRCASVSDTESLRRAAFPPSSSSYHPLLATPSRGVEPFPPPTSTV